MAEVLILSGKHVSALLDLDDLRTAVARAFCALSDGRASVPPRTAAFTNEGLLGAMPGYVSGSGLAAKLVSVFPENHAHGLPSHQAVICLFEAGSGTPVAVMDGAYVTAARTAAASATAAERLARPGSRTLAILGAGVQGNAHLEAFVRVFPLESIRISSRDRARAEALAHRHARAVTVSSFEEAVRGSDIVCCCTDAKQPILRRSWLSSGAHIGSVGIGAEVDPEILAHARIFVEWRGAVTSPPPAGAEELQGWDPGSVTEIGDVLLGRAEGRASPDDITLYKSTGHAVEDVAAAALVYEQAKVRRTGTVVEL